MLTVGAVFFLAEPGDKTMLATITLATREGVFGTWLGSTLGMVAADGLTISVGRFLGARLPERPFASLRRSRSSCSPLSCRSANLSQS